MALLITNARLVTWEEPNRIIENGALLIEGERIAATGAASELEAQYPDAERLDARGQLAMPGSICAHTHFYGADSRAPASPGPAAAGLPPILRGQRCPLGIATRSPAVRGSAPGC